MSCFTCKVCRAFNPAAKVPIKRYKKLVADIYVDQEVNNSKISKLVDYAKRNPHRLPRIASMMEEKAFQELRNERYGYVTVTMKAFSRMVHSCKNDISLFAHSVWELLHALLKHHRDDMRLVAADTLDDFINVQTSNTYMQQLDGVIPDLCQLAREAGEPVHRRKIRTAVLRAMLAMIHLMARTKYLSAGIGRIVRAVLDNLEEGVGDGPSDKAGSARMARLMSTRERAKRKLVDLKAEAAEAVRDSLQAVAAVADAVGMRKVADKAREEADTPAHVARQCMKALGGLALEAFTASRVYEAIFQHLDRGHHWTNICSINDQPLAHECVRLLLKSEKVSELKDKDGGAKGRDKAKDKEAAAALKRSRSPLLAVALVHHLRNSKALPPAVKKAIVDLVEQVASNPKAHSKSAGITPILAVRELARQYEISLSDRDAAREAANRELQPAIVAAINALVRMIGDTWLLMDMMGGILEKVSREEPRTRMLLQAVEVVAASVAGLSQDQDLRLSRPQAMALGIPEALLQQLLSAMAVASSPSRVSAHTILSTLVTRHDSGAGAFGSDAGGPRGSAIKGARPKFVNVINNKFRDMLQHLDRDSDSDSDSSADGAAPGGVGTGAPGGDERPPTSPGSDVAATPRGRGHKDKDKEKEKEKEKEKKKSKDKDKEGSPVARGLPHSSSVSAGAGVSAGDIELTMASTPVPPLRLPVSVAGGYGDDTMRGRRYVLLNEPQVNQLLSSFWVELFLPDATPANYAAIATTFILLLDHSGWQTVVKATQLTLSVRSRALDTSDTATASLSYCQRRSVVAVSHACLRALFRKYAPGAAPPQCTEPAFVQVCPYLNITDKAVIDRSAQMATPAAAAAVVASGDEDVASVPAGYSEGEQEVSARALWQKLSDVSGANVSSRDAGGSGREVTKDITGWDVAMGRLTDVLSGSSSDAAEGMGAALDPATLREPFSLDISYNIRTTHRSGLSTLSSTPSLGQLQLLKHWPTMHERHQRSSRHSRVPSIADLIELGRMVGFHVSMSLLVCFCVWGLCHCNSGWLHGLPLGRRRVALHGVDIALIILSSL
eukprot:jgi/Mesvir1/17201/Mv07619-RA.2